MWDKIFLEHPCVIAHRTRHWDTLILFLPSFNHRSTQFALPALLSFIGQQVVYFLPLPLFSHQVSSARGEKNPSPITFQNKQGDRNSRTLEFYISSFNLLSRSRVPNSLSVAHYWIVPIRNQAIQMMCMQTSIHVSGGKCVCTKLQSWK